MADVSVVNAVAVTEAAAGPALMCGDVCAVDECCWWESAADDWDLNDDVSAAASGVASDELSLLYRSV